MHGVFDSGLGGLSVWKEIKNRFPTSSTLYFADQAHLPYGSLPSKKSLYYVQGALDHLIEMGATSISMACHTISTTIIDKLRPLYSIPIYDISSASLQSAADYQKIAVIGTTNTIRSKYFQNVFKDRLHSATACPKLVPMVEEGVISRSMIESSLILIPPGADSIFLGCTHFSFIGEEISRALGGIKIIDPAAFFTSQLPPLASGGIDKFVTTGNVEKFHTMSENLVKRKLPFPFFIKPLYFREKLYLSTRGSFYEPKEKNTTN